MASIGITDLSKVATILGGCYSSNKGASSRDPIDMFRPLLPLLLIELIQASSIVNWTKKLKTFPVWAILSGFHPDDVSGVRTFYDF